LLLECPFCAVIAKAWWADVFGRLGAILFASTVTPCVTPNWQCLQGCTYSIYFILVSILLYISLVQNTKNKYGGKLCRYLHVPRYHRNSVDTYRSFRLSFPIVCSRELQFDDCQNSHLNQSLALDLLNLVLDFRIKSTYHNLLWKTAFFLFIKRNIRDQN
jgi:hypothetical protein